MQDHSQADRVTPYLDKKPSSLRYFQEGPAPVDLSAWRLDIHGEVKTPQSFDYDTLRAMPATHHHRRTVCVCLWTIKRHWYGVALRHVLQASGVDLEDDGLYLRQISNGTEKGRYDTTIHMRSASARDAVLAWSVDDAPRPSETGSP